VPELPDVEGFRRVLARHAGARIQKVVVHDRRVVRGTSARRFADALRGRRFRKPGRHGKWLIAPIDGRGVLLFHFGMTGSLSWHHVGEPTHRHDRVAFVHSTGELRYRDLRKLQGLRLALSDAQVRRVLGKLGPDALEVSRQAFDARVAGRRRLKAALMDQSVIAGLGNLLVDEICWRARVNPLRKGSDLSGEERRRMYVQMLRVLRASVRAARVPGYSSWLTGQRDKRDGACPRCRTKLARARINGRMTVWCPRCQPR
jgi:formamidopyrimidine-DNA glycosylase